MIEPRFIYSYASGVNNYNRILHFDDRDILTDTNEVEYAIVNRIYSKRTDAPIRMMTVRRRRSLP